MMSKWRRCDIVVSHRRQSGVMCLLGIWLPLAPQPPNILNLAPPPNILNLAPIPTPYPYSKPSYAYVYNNQLSISRNLIHTQIILLYQRIQFWQIFYFWTFHLLFTSNYWYLTEKFSGTRKLTLRYQLSGWASTLSYEKLTVHNSVLYWPSLHAESSYIRNRGSYTSGH